MEQTDQQLLQQYQRTGDGAALQRLIGRYLNQVYSSAVRQVRDRHMAEDVTQAVFILFSQKAGGLSPSVIVPGWLFRTTRYVSLHAMKKQSRRQWHEEHAARPERVEEDGPSAWQELSPRIDAAMAQLKERYRDALILRFFRSMSLAQVGQTMGISEEAARKLVDRGLDKLRGELASSGVACSEAGLVAALSSQVLETAPEQLAQWAAQVGGASTAAGSANALVLTKGALSIMATTKVKVAVAVIAVAAVAGGGTAVVKAIGSSDAAGRVAVARPAAPARQAVSEATVRDIRAAAIGVTTAAVEADTTAMEKITLVESPEYKEMAEAIRSLMGDAGRLRKLMMEKFGAVPEEMATWMPGGPEVFRKQYLPNAPVRSEGDLCMIEVGAQSRPPVFVFRQDEGKWKLLMGRSFCDGKPERANEMTAMCMRLAEVIRGVTDAIHAGECASARDVAELFASRLQEIGTP